MDVYIKGNNIEEQLLTQMNEKAKNADEAEKIRSTVKSKLREEDSINIQEISNELFKEDLTKKQDFEIFMKGNGLEEEVAVDKAWVEKKLKRIRLKIDKDIDLYINEDAYHDNSKF